MIRGRHITNWDPEDDPAWAAGGRSVARRNLICTIAADHVGFSIFALWAVLAMFLPQSIYGFTAGDKFLLGATATLIGGCARVPYTLGIARFGGRNWTVFSALVLLFPALGALYLMAHPGLPLGLFLLCAAASGLGGANFAASMANVNVLYPQRRKGWALAANAGLGNAGAAVIQVVGLAVLSIAGDRKPYWVCGIYAVLLVVVAVAAALFMDTIDHATDAGHIASVLRVPDSWLIMALYICTFGSWVGFTFAFGQVMQLTFVKGGQAPAQAALHALQFAWLGPLLGSLARVPGGTLADRRGGGRVTLVVLVGMTAAAALLIGFSTHSDHAVGPMSTAATVGYAGAFLVLFGVAGVGNASVFKMIPSVFEARSRSLDLDQAGRRHWAQTHSSALIGITGAVGALGGVAINLVLRHSYLGSGSATSAYWVFLCAYGLAAVATWRRYVRVPASPVTPVDAAPIGISAGVSGRVREKSC